MPVPLHHLRAMSPQHRVTGQSRPRGPWLPRLIVASALVSGLVSVSPWADEERARFGTIDEYIQAYWGETDAKIRTGLFYEMAAAIHRRDLVFSGQEAPRLIEFSAHVVADAGAGLEKHPAVEIMLTHPHRVAADILYDFVTVAQEDEVGIWGQALAVLASLQDKRIFPLLAERLTQPHMAAARADVRMLVELGDPRGVALLEGVAGDPDRKSLFRKAQEEHAKTHPAFAPHGEDDYEKQAAEERRLARGALRDLHLYLDHGIVGAGELDDHAHAGLARNGFVILPEEKNELYEFYDPRYPYVTVDVVFRTFMILMRASLDELERLVCAPLVRDFTRAMAFACLRQAGQQDSKNDRDLALHNAACFTVAAELCAGSDLPDIVLPSGWDAAVQAEIERILAAETVANSPILGVEEDYSEYRPRGRHSATPELAGYFRTMSWLGRSTWLREQESDTRRAVLLLDVLAQAPALRAQWEALDRLLGRFFGEPDDATVTDYERVAAGVLQRAGRAGVPAREILGDDALWLAFREALADLPLPRVNSAHESQADGSGWRARRAGLRILGQRYSRDMHLFQLTLEAGRWPCSGLQVAATLLGSARAAELLRESGWPLGPEGAPAIPVPGDRIGGLPEGSLFCAETLFETPAGVPTFMESAPWEERLIGSALGAWAEVRHTVALYSKSAHVYLGVSQLDARFHGYVDPYPAFYERLGQLVARVRALMEEQHVFARIEEDRQARATRRALGEASQSREDAMTARQGRRLPSESDEEFVARSQRREPEGFRRQLDEICINQEMLGDFASILSTLTSIANKELCGEGQSIDDGLFLKDIGERLKTLSFNTSSMNLCEIPMSQVIDVATEYMSGQCLEIAVGRPRAIYVCVPDAGRSYVCRGGVYAYHEFLRQADQRLDDAAWQQLLAGPGAVDYQPWIASRPELGLARTLTRRELQELSTVKAAGRGNAFPGSVPMVDSDDRGPVARLQGAKVAREDLDLLLDIADSDSVDWRVQIFALERLRDLASEPEVLLAYRRQLDRVAEGPAGSMQSMVSSLYYTILGLGACGTAAGQDLDRAEGIVQRLFRGDSPRDASNRVHFRRALEDARARVQGKAG